MRIKLQLIVLQFELCENSPKSTVKDVNEAYLMQLENLIRDIRNAKGWK
jgi:hypothetical protein